MRIRILFTVLLACSFDFSASAWVYPEHRKIMMTAIVKLDSSQCAALDRLWESARKGYESRLCTGVIEPEQSVNPGCLDYAAWCGIAGDHSVSARDMTEIILQSPWILHVADIAARLQVGLDNSQNRSERIRYMRDSDLKLLRADPEYVTRAAGKNNGHFMMALPAVNTIPGVYFALCYREGAELNTVGTYTWYHMSALSKASLLNSDNLTPGQRSSLALSALADEAFAVHFLEDSFTSGHVAGIWGDAAKRKGTHDYYNEEGLDVTTWQGIQMVLMGDATMQEDDLGWSSAAVRRSLQQVLDAACGKILVNTNRVDLSAETPDTFNVSKAIVMPLRPIDSEMRMLCDTILMATPIPGLKAGPGELPRFRAEIGPFVGLSAATGLNYLDGGFFQYQTHNGFSSGFELGLRFGLGMEGVLNESGDGLVFLDLGARIDLGSTMRYDYDDELPLDIFGDFAAAIPSRNAYYIRLRLPFYLIPGDLLILAPLLALTSPDAMQKVVATAGNGGLIPWQTGLPTPIGRFQFVLGREMAISMYGAGRRKDIYLATIKDAVNEMGGPVEGHYALTSTRFEFPIVEYRPFRTYSTRQTGSLLFQLNAGFDIPGKRTTISVTEGKDYAFPDTHTIWYAGIRLVFDYRYYFGGGKK